MFVDTAGWAAIADSRQTYHAQAAARLRQARISGSRLITTNFVLAELTALLTSPIRMSRPKQITFLTAIRSAAWVEVVHIDPARDAAAWKLWEARPDKDWSFVDCASFVVMQERSLMDALTSDHHYEQAGFIRLLK